MNCPKCQNLELENGGPCPVCGYRPVSEPGRADEAEGTSGTLVEQAAANDTVVEVELPEWRQELSRRLQEIKSKRESTEAKAPVAGEAADFSEPSLPAAPVEPQPFPRRAAPRRSRPSPDFQQRKEPIQEVLPATSLSPVLPIPSPEPGIQQSAAAVASAGDLLIHRPVRESQDRDIQKLIDSIRTSQSAVEQKRQPAPEAKPRIEPKDPGEKRPEPVPLSKTTTEVPIPQVLVPEADEDKLILLTRTLAGLVDLIIVVVSAGLMVIAVDILEGIDVFDTTSKVYYSLLFLTTYFLYSLFFLGTANQTIGMMLTDLRLVSTSSGRLGVSQVLLRCSAFLLGLAVLGIGLLWGCFDSRAYCLHDRLSHSRVMKAA